MTEEDLREFKNRLRRAIEGVKDRKERSRLIKRILTERAETPRPPGWSAVEDIAYMMLTEGEDARASETERRNMVEKVLAFIFAIVAFGLLVASAVIYPEPTEYQWQVFRTLLSVAAGGFAAVLPGALGVEFTWGGITLRATLALGVWLIVYLFAPGRSALYDPAHTSPPSSPVATTAFKP